MAGFASFCFVAIWLSLPALVTSVPVNDASIPAMDQPRDTLHVPVKHNLNARRHGALEYYDTMMKYHIDIPEHLQKVVSRLSNAVKAPVDKDGSTPAISEDGDLEWLAPASLGTPGQQLNMDFDTGSADTWVYSTDTDESHVMGQTLYDPVKSSTAKLVPNTTWDIIYGDFSSCRGIVYKDTFTLGSIEIPGMTIESAESVSSSFSKQRSLSGLLGLAFPSIIQTTPAMPSLQDFLAGALTQNLFTSDLKHNSSKGSYNFGYIDDSLHGSDVEYVTVDKSEGFWSVKMSGFGIGGSPFTYEFSSPPSVILDTGSTLFYAPDEAVVQYFQSVPGANFSYEEYGYTLPCNSTPPDFFWQLGDPAVEKTVTGKVPGSYLIYDVLEGGMCYAGLQSLGGYSSLQGIFGDVWLKSGFQVWDIGNVKFGHAPKVLDLDLNLDSHVDESRYRRKKRVVI